MQKFNFTAQIVLKSEKLEVLEEGSNFYERLEEIVKYEIKETCPIINSLWPGEGNQNLKIQVQSYTRDIPIIEIGKMVEGKKFKTFVRRDKIKITFKLSIEAYSECVIQTLLDELGVSGAENKSFSQFDFIVYEDDNAVDYNDILSDISAIVNGESCDYDEALMEIAKLLEKADY